MGLRAMFSGISGLQSHSTWLDVIGNNISNTNTVAYKSSRVEFADQISQTLFGGSGDNPGSNLGGVNPQQVGLGTRVASIQTLFTAGPTLQTGLSTDVAIVGDGFLIAKSGSRSFLTRAGNFTFDGLGNLTDQNGGLIQGFTAAIRYTTRVLNTTSSVAGQAALITDAAFVLDNTNIGAVSNIQIKAGLVEPARATQMINFGGNLDSFQQANRPGGVLQIGSNAAPVLPIALAGVTFLAAKMNKIPYPVGPGQALRQFSNLAFPLDPGVNALTNHTTAVITGAVNLNAAAASATNAWQQQPPVPPAQTSVQTVYDSLGNPRQVTFQFYQVNDLGTAVPLVNTPPLNQAAYAWYAFDTTNGAAVNNASLIGGTGIIEGQTPFAGGGPGFDRGVAGSAYWGDLIYFNTDGSLASEGAVNSLGGSQTKPHLYLPPSNTNPPTSPLPTIGAEVLNMTVNFGTAGLLTFGRRDGLISDAQGSFQVVNGVNTYVPNHTAFVKSQDGYRDGTLQGIQFDKTGTIQGTFSNGQVTALGQLVMALPDNKEGLSKVGGNYFVPSPNSGPMFIGLPGQNGTNLGTIVGNSLEGSNVDLTVELSNMIIAQRGFEVNARVIAVSNTLLEATIRLGLGG